ncbi:MAG: outer membrane lipoprotein-sorting protein [Candidatus Omnitrophota bacterium]
MRENSNICFKAMREVSLCIIFVYLFCAYSFVCAAVELTGQEIIKRSDDLMRGDTSHGRYKMTVITPDWQRTLELEAYSAGRDRTFIRVLSPVKEAGVTSLRVKTNMWNYLPKIERMIKIPPSMMLQPWMGSDYTNDDLVKESSVVYDYTHVIADEENIGSDTAYKVELTPKPRAPVTWGKLIFWVRKKDFVPLREEFYSEHAKLIKVLEYSEVKQMSDRSIPTVWKMISSVKERHITIVEVQSVIYNQPLDENIFTMGNLKSVK